MIFKKYIDSSTLKELPQNGVILIEYENEQGEKVIKRTGVSNIPTAFERDTALAHLNGYYEYAEGDMPEYDEQTEYLTYEYILEDEVIFKKWIINNIEPPSEYEESGD